MIVKRPRGVYCSMEEREAIRKRAAAAGKSVSRLFLDAVLADDADSRASALTAEEQAELLEGFPDARCIHACPAEQGGG